MDEGASKLSSTKLTTRLIVIAAVFALAGCAATQPPSAENNPRPEFKFAGGTFSSVSDPPTDTSVEVKYDDGAILKTVQSARFGSGVHNGSVNAFEALCKNPPNCPEVQYQDRFYGVGPIDGRNWMDTELWLLGDFNASSDGLKYQACRNGHIYSAGDLKTLMDVIDKVESNPAGAKSDPEVAKQLVTDDALVLRLPVCNWRHRIGLEAVYPPPANAAKVRIVPASHTRFAYVEAKGDNGGVDIYIDTDHRRIDRFVFTSSKGSFSLRPVYSETDCPLLDRCEHMTLELGKHQDLLDIRSLDDEPLSQSRLFEVRNTRDGTKQYDGCAGGRLYAGKNRQTVESEIKIALENPAPPRPQGAPMLGAPAISESGDTVIPDGFCDWTVRTRQMQAAMKNQGAEPSSNYVPGAWRQ